MTAEELERQLIESSSTSTPPMTPRSSSIQSPKGVLPQSPSAFTPQIHSPGIILDRSPRPQGMNLSGMMQHQRLPPHMVPPNSPGSFAQAQRMMAANAQLHQNPHHYAMAIHQQQQHHMRMMQMNPQLRGRMPFPGMPFPPMPPGHPMHRPGFPMMPGPGMMPHPNFFRQMDPYGGLMNEKDKQRLRNIAIIQLQNDHPYTTDYYSLVSCSIHFILTYKLFNSFLTFTGAYCRCTKLDTELATPKDSVTIYPNSFQRRMTEARIAIIINLPILKTHWENFRFVN